MRKHGYSSLIWGGLLVILGLGFLAENLDLLGDWNMPVGSLVLGAISLMFLAIFASDREQWWALIPGLVVLGVAAAVFFAEQDLIADHVVATIILAGVGLPFLLIFLMDRDHWWALIPGMTMSGIAVAVLLEGTGFIGDEMIGGVVVGGIALGFLSIYMIDRKQWWAMIPGGILGTIACLLLIAGAVDLLVPVVIILIGLLMLRGSLGGRRRRERRSTPLPGWSPSIDAGELDRAAKASKRERLPTLEEQIAAAVAEGETATEPSDDFPSAPEAPPPPETK
jgi:hypothetical protein